MKVQLFAVSFLCAAFLDGAVTAAKLPDGKQGEARWKLENEYISVVVSARGGIVEKFTDRKAGKELVGGEGAFRDQFAPRNTDFSKALYRGGFTAGRPDEKVLTLTAPSLDGAGRYLLVSKKYILRDGESKLGIEVTTGNRTESMQDLIVEYWSNSFFGVEKAPDSVFVPLQGGVLKELSGSNIFYKEPIRGWIALTGGGTGVALLPEYRRFGLAYSWNCRGPYKRNTFEFRLVPEKIVPGASATWRFEAGLLSGGPEIHGAGSAGFGTLRRSPERLTAVLRGFAPVKALVRLNAGGRRSAPLPVTLTPEKDVSVSFPLPEKTGKFTVEISDAEGKLLFDLLPSFVSGAEFAALEKRNDPPRDKDPWQFDPAPGHVTPHFKWLDNKKFTVLFLMEPNGARDIIELHQRMNFDFKAPTVFPSSWTRGWRTKVPFAPSSGNEPGTKFVAPYLKKRSDVIVIGDGRTFVRMDKQNKKVSSWTAYPTETRKAILAAVRNGTGLLLVNPCAPDEEMKRLLASLKEPPAFFRASMSFGAAPYFSQALLKTGKYGKGRVAVITFRTDAFLVPLLKRRQRHFQLLSCEHRFHEYQFAVMARLVNFVRGGEPALLALSDAGGGKVRIRCAQPSGYRFELFNRYSSSYAKFTANLEAGENIVPLPGLQEGMNYLHVRLPGKDFGFLALKHTAPARISAIKMGNSFKSGETVSGTIEATGPGTVEYEIADNTGRLLLRGKGTEFSWDSRNAAVNRHVLTARLRSGGRVVSELRKEFYLPEVFDLRKEYSNLVWTGADMFPEYLYPERYRQLRTFGFNFLYGGSFGDAAPLLLRYADVETGMNWHAGGQGRYHLPYAAAQKSLEKWYKTGKKEFIVRDPCWNNPAFKAKMHANAPPFAPFYSRHLFQLGDEMSTTVFQTPMDFCFCPWCLAGFRKYLQTQGFTLEKLNALWKTGYKKWDEVMPQTFNDTLVQPNPAAFVAHRLYMDGVFARSLLDLSAEIRKKYPLALVGPTGVKNTPSAYGGNWNFWSMSRFDCVSIYGRARIPVSFNREKRFVMSYYGYDNPEGSTRLGFWEGLFAGERNNNNWFCPIFLLPDLRHSQVRAYYSRILWELRSGPGDLLYHARKVTDCAAILLSQRSVIANFLKPVKVDLPEKLFSFARVLEDLGIPARFVAQEELSAELLGKFKVLILPEASALSDREIGLVKEFVEKGGKVIADYEAGIFDEHCVARQEFPLDGLFGIAGGRRVLRQVNSHDLAGLTIRHAVTGIRCVKGKALGEAVTRRGRAPLACVNGNALYLNFEPLYNIRREKAFRDLIGGFLKLSGPARFDSPHSVMHSFFTDGDALYIALLPDPVFPNWQESTPEQAAKHTVKGTLELKKAAFLYDVRKGKFLGKGTKFPLAPVQGEGMLLAALPAQVSSVVLSAPGKIPAGSRTGIAAAVRTASGKAGNCVLLLRAFRPDGSESLEFRRIRHAPEGKFTFPFAPALNEKGLWRFTVKDAASGVENSCRIGVY